MRRIFICHHDHQKVFYFDFWCIRRVIIYSFTFQKNSRLVIVWIQNTEQPVWDYECYFQINQRDTKGVIEKHTDRIIYYPFLFLYVCVAMATGVTITLNASYSLFISCLSHSVFTERFFNRDMLSSYRLNRRQFVSCWGLDQYPLCFDR